MNHLPYQFGDNPVAPLAGTTSLASWMHHQLRQRDWTRSDFAGRVGVPESTVAKWMAGNMEPTPDSMQRIADALYVSIDDVLHAAGIRPQVVYDDPRVVELVNMLRRIEPSEERLTILKAHIASLLDIDRQRVDAQRRRRKLAAREARS